MREGKPLPPALLPWHMTAMPLDFSALANAVARLAEGLARFHVDESDTQIRDG